MALRIGNKYKHLAGSGVCSCCAPETQEMLARINAMLTRRGFMFGAAAVTAAAATAGMPDLAMAQAATPKPVLFTNVNVFDGKSPALAKGMNVLVEGGMIKSVSAEAITASDGAMVIDGGGRTLMPGLIDAHVHIFMTASTLPDLSNPESKPEDLFKRAEEEATAMLMRGFTTVRDVGGPVFGIRRSIEAGKLAGPRIYPSGATVSQTSGHGDSRLPNEKSRRFGGTTSAAELMGVGFIADGRDEVLTAVRENLRAGATQIKVMAGGGAATAYDPLDVAQYTFDELKAAVEAADDWNTYVTVHAYTVKSVRRAVEAGVKCIEHGQLLDEATIKLLAKQDIWLSLQALDPAPPTQTPDVIKKKQMVVDGTNNAYTWAKKHNVKLAWGTDFLFFPPQNLKQTSDILKLKQWFNSAEILKMVTHDNAQLMTLSGPRNPYPAKLGVVEADAYADLILVDGDPIANIDLIGDHQNTFKIIMKGGEIFKNTL
jgi:imidazolonepropionase-like amidohydrolase